MLVHGWPQHWWMWRKVVPLLAPHARLVMPDLRGFGWSDAPPDPYDKQTLADDLLAVLDALGLERVRLVAHDWGGWSGFLACLAAPERFERTSPSALRARRAAASARQLREVWRFAYQVVIASPILGRRVARRFLERTIMAGAVNRAGWTPADLRGPATVLAQPARARASVRLYRTFLTREVARTPRGHLRVPTRIVVGSGDPAVPPCCSRTPIATPTTWASRSSPIAGISCPRSAQSSSPSAHAPSSGCIDPEICPSA